MKLPSKHLQYLLLLSGSLGCTFPTYAALTDLANAPMASASNTSIKPNIMFILDDSGSMGWEFLPDSVDNYASKPCYKNYLYNSVYYNPNYTYNPPVDAVGTPYANASFTAARTNGFSSSSSTVNLNSSFKAGNDSNGTQAYYYNYTGGGTPTPGTCYADNKYTKVNVSPSSAEAQNFANWYSYYRTRMLTMKTAVGRAFTAIGSNYRVGFSTINYTGTDTTNAEFLNISDFDATQKAAWYSKLYAISPGNSTPLRGALSKAGRIFAGKLGTDPVQYSCQQNFALLTTDGYWNESGTPVQIDGTTAIGNQDGDLATAPRPMYDGSSEATVVTTNYTRDNYSTTTSGCSGSKKKLKVQPEKATYSVTTTNGVTQPGVWSAWTNNGSSYTSGSCANSITLPSPDPSDPVAGTTTTTTTTSGGSTNSLADVAMYYYKTDLRTSGLSNCTGALGAGVDVCENNVPGADPDNADHQHMTTFSLGLGVSGTLTYQADYLTATSGDYYDLTQGTQDWPTPVNNDPTGVDDLWHAAVDGRGVYFSAKDPDSLVNGLTNALAGMTARDGAQSAAATSNLEPVPGDNYSYIARYISQKWVGDLESRTIDLATGNLTDTVAWNAQPLLDSKVAAASDSRSIYTFDAAAASKLKDFTWANLTATEKAYFSDVCTPTAKLSQCPLLSATDKTAASGTNLVNFIRGQRGFESSLYRVRDHILGDIVSSNPVFVGPPTFEYLDTNYDAFKNTSQKNRTSIVYVGSNDGMLHAFNATTGQEEWAYIPPLVMTNLYLLADKNYAPNHTYFVDGPPTVGDICPNAPSSTCTGNQWKTILVGGLNSGGRGFYALDVTNPSSPKGLWNFTLNEDSDLGYSFGNPIITKRKDGTWVVVVTSGYNNVSPGDGKGYLYVLNANTGAVLEKIGTNVGSTTTPSGLAKINAWVRDTNNNTAERFYGGDLFGNVWRFDIDDNVAPSGKEALLLAVLGQINGAGTQPITTKPELTEATPGNFALVHIGTGRYLGVTDLSDTSQQSFYTIRDKLIDTGLGQVRQSGVLVEHTLEEKTDASGHLIRTLVSPGDVDYALKSGWYIDFDPTDAGGTHLSPGERMAVDMQMQGTTLTVATNVPNASACTAGGYSWKYHFNFKTGHALQSAANLAVGERLSINAMVAGMKLVRLPDGKTILIITDTAGSVTTVEVPQSDAATGGARRVSWRELIQ